VTFCFGLQEQAARLAQAELEMRITETKIKEDEARRLQLELHNARIQMEQNRKALQEVMSSHGRTDEDDVNSEQSMSRHMLSSLQQTYTVGLHSTTNRNNTNTQVTHY